MNSKGYGIHIFSLSALFTLGNAVITIPLSAKNLLLAAAFSVFLILLCSLAVKIGLKNRVYFCTAALPISAIAAYGFLTAAFDYIMFLKAIQMPDTNTFLTSAVLIAAVALCAFCSNSSILKYSLLSAVICALFFALNFIGGIQSFDYLQAKHLWQSYFSIGGILRFVLPTTALALFVFLSQKRAALTSVITGAAAGFLVLALCLVQIIFTLGPSEIQYPYIKAISVISSGNLFTRLDGFVYFIFFATTLVKLAVCVKAIVLTVKTIFCKRKTEDC